MMLGWQVKMPAHSTAMEDRTGAASAGSEPLRHCSFARSLHGALAGGAGALTYTAQPLPGASSSLAALDTPPTPGVQVHGRDLNRPQRRGEA